MGKRIKSEHPEPNEESHTEKTGRHNRNTSTQQTEESTKRKRGRPRKSESGTTEKENVPRLVTVELPNNQTEDEDISPPKPKKKENRGRPKKTTQKKVGLTKENLSAILKSTSDVLGSRDGWDMWKLDEKECNQLAEPLAKIMQRSSYLEKVTDEYGDYIALMIAAVVIILPRLMLQLKQNKEKKKENDIQRKKEIKKNGSESTRKPDSQRNESGTIGTSDRRHDKQVAPVRETFGEELHRLIPSFG